jgi:hypothetical protein
MFNAFEPMNPMVPPQNSGRAVESVKFTTLLSKEPPESVKALLPSRAPAFPKSSVPPFKVNGATIEPVELKFNTPELTVMVPVFVETPPKAKVPGPTNVKPSVPPPSPIAPPTVRVPATTVTVLDEPVRVTEPLPKFSEFVPMNPKLPAQISDGLLSNVKFAKPLLSEPPLIVSTELAPKALEPLKSNVPALMVKEPAMAPLMFNNPAVSVVKPV